MRAAAANQVHVFGNGVPLWSPTADIFVNASDFFGTPIGHVNTALACHLLGSSHAGDFSAAPFAEACLQQSYVDEVREASRMCSSKVIAGVEQLIAATKVIFNGRLTDWRERMD